MRDLICGRPLSLCDPCETQDDGAEVGGEVSVDSQDDDEGAARGLGSSAKRFGCDWLHFFGGMTVGLDLLERSDSVWKNWRTISVALSMGMPDLRHADTSTGPFGASLTNSSSNQEIR